MSVTYIIREMSVYDDEDINSPHSVYTQIMSKQIHNLWVKQKNHLRIRITTAFVKQIHIKKTATATMIKFGTKQTLVQGKCISLPCLVFGIIKKKQQNFDQSTKRGSPENKEYKSGNFQEQIFLSLIFHLSYTTKTISGIKLRMRYNVLMEVDNQGKIETVSIPPMKGRASENRYT